MFDLLRQGVTLLLEIVLFCFAFVATWALLDGYESGFEIAVVALLWLIYVGITEMARKK